MLVIRVQIIESNVTMVGRRMMLGVIFCLVGFSGDPVYNEMALFDLIADLLEAHINCLRAYLFAGVVEDGGGGCVVGFDGRHSSFVTHFFKGCSE